MKMIAMDAKKGLGLLYFATGLGAGIALTVLLAPRSGAATRRLICHKVEEREDWLKAKADAAQDSVRGHVEDLRHRAQEVLR